MLLCLDVGNTHILAGVFDQGKIIARFRAATHLLGTADQFGLFLLNMLGVKNIPLAALEAVAIASVVPSQDFTLRHTCSLYLKNIPCFMLAAGAKTGLNITCKHPNEVGADLIAGAIGGIEAFPHKNLLIVDMGTATTICAITAQREYLGGAILPGIRLSMEALKSNTAKLMAVDIEAPPSSLGRSTKECIQAGLYYGHLGALHQLISNYQQDIFPTVAATVIGTGGFAQLYKDANIFDVILPDLVLQGIYRAYDYHLGKIEKHDS